TWRVADGRRAGRLLHRLLLGTDGGAVRTRGDEHHLDGRDRRRDRDREALPAAGPRPGRHPGATPRPGGRGPALSRRSPPPARALRRRAAPRLPAPPPTPMRM